MMITVLFEFSRLTLKLGFIRSCIKPKLAESGQITCLYTVLRPMV